MRGKDSFPQRPRNEIMFFTTFQENDISSNGNT